MDERDMPRIFVPTDDRRAPARLRMPAGYEEGENWVAEAMPEFFTWNEQRQVPEFDRDRVTDVAAVLHRGYRQVKVVYGVMETAPESSRVLTRGSM